MKDRHDRFIDETADTFAGADALLEVAADALHALDTGDVPALAQARMRTHAARAALSNSWMRRDP